MMHLVWIPVTPDLARRKHCRPHRCGPPRKKPAGCPQDPLGPPGTPGPTHYSTAGRQHAPPAARRPETGAAASSLSGRSGDACTTCQLEAHRERRHENLLLRQSVAEIKPAGKRWQRSCQQQHDEYLAFYVAADGPGTTDG